MECVLKYFLNATLNFDKSYSNAIPNLSSGKLLYLLSFTIPSIILETEKKCCSSAYAVLSEHMLDDHNKLFWVGLNQTSAVPQTVGIWKVECEHTHDQ
jgi:hypothetical protein